LNNVGILFPRIDSSFMILHFLYFIQKIFSTNVSLSYALMIIELQKKTNSFLIYTITSFANIIFKVIQYTSENSLCIHPIINKFTPPF